MKNLLVFLISINSICNALEVLDPARYSVSLEDTVWGDTLPTGGQLVDMTLGTNKRKYRCFIPDLVSNDSSQSTQLDTLSPAALLKPLEGSCLYRLEGWWTYEFCYGKHLRQFHQDKDKPIRPQDEFFMGYGNELIAGEIKDNYYSTHYDGGTVCDINGQQRRSEIRFVCNNERPTSNLMDINEAFSCSYTVSVHTPLLCRHPKFKPKQEVIHPIRCKLINPLSEEELKEMASNQANTPEISEIEFEDLENQQQQSIQGGDDTIHQFPTFTHGQETAFVMNDGSILVSDLAELIQNNPALASQLQNLAGDVDHTMDESEIHESFKQQQEEGENNNLNANKQPKQGIQFQTNPQQFGQAKPKPTTQTQQDVDSTTTTSNQKAQNVRTQQNKQKPKIVN